MEGSNNGSYEFWVHEDGTVQMIPFADLQCQEFETSHVDDVINSKP